MRSAVVLLSGGQDSTTCLYWTRPQVERLVAVSFDYGQKHLVELRCAAHNAKHAGVDEHLVLPLQGLTGKSALTQHEEDVSAAHPLAPELPASFTAGRNILFLTVAAAVAYDRGIENLVGGMCQTDYSGYPDCRREFIDSMEKSLSLGLGKPLVIHTPLMFLTKAETWKMAADLGVLKEIIEHTHTDYNGDHTTLNDWGYGKLDNPASVIRARGWAEAKEKGWV